MSPNVTKCHQVSPSVIEPLHRPRFFKREERRKRKLLAPTMWYRSRYAPLFVPVTPGSVLPKRVQHFNLCSLIYYSYCLSQREGCLKCLFYWWGRSLFVLHIDLVPPQRQHQLLQPLDVHQVEDPTPDGEAVGRDSRVLLHPGHSLPPGMLWWQLIIWQEHLCWKNGCYFLLKTYIYLSLL